MYKILSLFVFSFSAFSGTMGEFNAHFKPYIGVFGGFSGATHSNASQSGVAYRYIGQLFPGQNSPTDENYDLYVDVTGNQKMKTGGIAGAHVGLQGQALSFNNTNSFLMTPALELEGFYLGSQLSGMLSNPILEPAVLRPEGTVSATHSISESLHQFNDTFDLNTGFLFANAMVDLNFLKNSILTPYAGLGIGLAFNRLSGANSDQIAPYNEDVNHFNSGTSDLDTVIAGQVKAGFHKALLQNFVIFAEYRYVYVAPTSYTFGNTYYPGHHPDTSKWQFDLSSMNLQTGVFGINYVFNS